MYGTFFGKVKSAKNTNNDIPFRYVVKKEDETIELIAEITKTSVEMIRELNPMLFNGRIKHQKVKLYPGQEIIVDEVSRVSLPPPPECIDGGWGSMHVVKASDTLETIAEQYNTSVSMIRNDNRQYFPQGDRGILFPGQMLHIRLVNTVDSETRKSHSNFAKQNDIQYHVVGKDDTWEYICDKYGLSYNNLLEKNRLLFPVGCRLDLKSGMKLVVSKDFFLSSGRRNIAEVKLTKQIHVVEEGDTPEKVAHMYDMSLDEIREYNRAYFPKGYRGEIKVGQQLVVKRPPQEEPNQE